MPNKFYGVFEHGAKAVLLNFLELLWMLDERRFSRTMLMESLHVPYSIARAFSLGKSKKPYDCYRKLSDVNPQVIEAIIALVSQIEQARATDKLLEKPTIEGSFYKDTRKNK